MMLKLNRTPVLLTLLLLFVVVQNE